MTRRGSCPSCSSRGCGRCPCGLGPCLRRGGREGGREASLKACDIGKMKDENEEIKYPTRKCTIINNVRAFIHPSFTHKRTIKRFDMRIREVIRREQRLDILRGPRIPKQGLCGPLSLSILKLLGVERVDAIAAVQE